MNYYNYKIEEVMELDVNKYNTLTKLMYINIARDSINANESSAYPKLTEQKRNEIHKRLHKIAYPANFEVKNIVKLGDLSKVLNG